MVASLLFSAPLTNVQEFSAMTGFLVMSITFRDLLGFSRLPTTGASEVLAIGGPILCVAFGMAASWIKKWRTERCYRK
jgi:hypothetical protein